MGRKALPRSLSAKEWLNGFDRASIEDLAEEIVQTEDHTESWLLLERMEIVLRQFTRYHRTKAYIDADSYEDFVDRLQLMIDQLRVRLKLSDSVPIPDAEVEPPLPELKFD